jgi:hypothetical protein
MYEFKKMPEYLLLSKDERSFFTKLLKGAIKKRNEFGIYWELQEKE